MMSEESRPLEKFGGLKFSEMKGCVIKDATGKNIGKLQDAIFKKTEDNIELSKFLVGGSFWEELLEDLGLRPDIDPVFPVDVIEGVSPKSIRINVKKDDLKSTTLDSDAITEAEFKLSELGKFKLVDANNEPIGNIIDVTFSRAHFQFIIGDGFIRELAEHVGILADVDLLLEMKFITEFSVEKALIKLNRDKLALKEIFEKHIPTATKDHDLQYDEVRKAMYFPRSQF